MNNIRIKLLAICVLLIFIFTKSQAQSDVGWKAKWISTMECQSATNTWLAFRKKVELQSKPDKALVKIAVDSKYWLWINGQLVVFEGGLKRGPNPLDTYYDEVDLASYLKAGDNTIAVLVWYFGKDGFSHKSSGRAGLIFDCQAPKLEILSDSSWKSALLSAYQTASEPLPNFRLSESSILYDGRKDKESWQSADYDDKWMPQAMIIGQVSDYPWNKLVLRPIPLFKDYGLKPYPNQNIIADANVGDTIICELPYNAQITPYFRIEATEGQKITIFTDNYLYYSGGTPNIRAEYITKNGIQEYESLGWINGHKVYYIIPKGIKVLDLKYRESGYDTEFEGRFNCSNPFFNKLWHKAQRTLYITMRDTYMDCPERERAQWTGDAVNEAGESFYALSVSSHALTKKWLHELLQWQKPDGSLYAPVPAGNWDKELPGQVLASVGYYGLWTYYQYTGDKQTISDLYDGVQRYLNMWKPDGKGTMNFRKGDWTWGDWGEERDMLQLYNLWYFLAIKGMHNIAVELGKTDDAEKYTSFMANFKKAFNEKFWTGSAYRNPDYKGKTDDRSQALAVVAGIADKEKFPQLLKVFQTEEHASPYMEKYVFEAMMLMGYEKEALDRHQKRFDKIVNSDKFTTLFEGWDVGINGYGGGTVNHAWSGGGLTILSQYICGVAPTSPGFKTFEVKPRFGNLTEASTLVPTVMGNIDVEITKASDRISINLSVPTGTKAEVYIPLKYSKITQNGKSIKGKKYHEYNLVVISEGKFRFIANK